MNKVTLPTLNAAKSADCLLRDLFPLAWKVRDGRPADFKMQLNLQLAFFGIYFLLPGRSEMDARPILRFLKLKVEANLHDLP